MSAALLPAPANGAATQPPAGIAVGDEIEWGIRGQERRGIVRVTDDTGLLVAGSNGAQRRLPWDAPGLHVVSAQLSLPLTDEEQQELRDFEAVIERGRQTFLEVGNALGQIRDRRLYRSTHGTFEDYLRERWDMGTSRAHQLMESAAVYQALESSTMVEVLPANERQVRPLTQLPAEERTEAWKDAVETAPEGQVTGKHVEEVVRERKEAKIDYRDWKTGQHVQWDDGRARRFGVIDSLQAGTLVVHAKDGKEPLIACLLPDRPGLVSWDGVLPEAPAAVPSPEPEVPGPEPTPAVTASVQAEAPPEPPAAETKPNALKSAEEIVAEKAGTAVPTTIGAAELDAPVTMCMVAQDSVDWIASDGMNVKTFLTRLKAAAYHRGQGAADLLTSLES